MIRLAADIAMAIKAGIALGMLLTRCVASDGIGPDGQYISNEVAVVEKAAPVEMANKLPEVTMYSASYCGVCPDAQKLLFEAQSEGELPFRIVVVKDEKFAPAWVKTFPCFVWGDGETASKSKQTWKAEGWKGVDNLIERFELSRPKKPRARPQDTRFDWIAREFHPIYVETKLGYTSQRHLIEDHHIPADVVRKYSGNQQALDRIHGHAHVHGK